MACSIIRNKTTNEIENVLANNGQPSLLFQAINQIVADKEKSLDLWASVYTPTFKNKFGDWESVALAKARFDKDIRGLYKNVAASDPNHFLFEISVQAHSSPSERKGAVSAVGEQIVKFAESIYPNVSVEDTYEASELYELDENDEPALTDDVITFLNIKPKEEEIVKKGVSELFESNPELANIGTPEQYSQYLDTIFPESKVKDIVYHGTKKEFDKFSKEIAKQRTGFHFTTKVGLLNSRFNFPKTNKTVILNIKNPLQVEDLGGNNQWAKDLLLNQGKIEEANKVKGWDIQRQLSSENDGFIYNNEAENEGKNEISYMVFEPEQIHILGSKQDVEGFKDFVQGQNTQNPNNVNYQLKSVEILSSDKAKQLFEKGKKNNWDLNKILTELQIPKEQKQLILNKNTTDREEIITSLLADNSYTIEINTAKATKQASFGESSDEDSFKFENKNYYRLPRLDEDMNLTYEYDYYAGNKRISKSSYESALNTARTNKINTQYYSNLSAPGGTNGRNKYEGNPDWEYQELEFKTPLITPSIKGHAQFATDNGIGWVRLWYNRKTGVVEIQEVQSDLFQKGRDSTTLVSNPAKQKEWNYFTSSNGEKYSILYKEENGEIKFRFYDGTSSKLISKEDLPQDVVDFARKERERLDSLKIKSENQFLQLLNKDNNWVTFFVKSIIQDSAKKGYEKVLFPTGNTASKVEGHDTLEEFKKQKEDRINSLQDRIGKLTIQKEGETYTVYDGKIQASSGIITKELAEQFLKSRNEVMQNEINQLKQELERVETEGFGALKPIYNFYENTVANILKKQGYNPTLITDEYGNTWNEISDLKKEKILLQKQSLVREQAPSFEKLGFTFAQMHEKRSQYPEVRQNQYRETLNKLSKKFGIEWIEDNTQENIGRYQDGKVYINTLKIRPDTPFHEFAHPFEQLLKQKNHTLWKVLASKAKKTTYKGENVFNNVQRLYPELSGEDLISETIVTILGISASDPDFVNEPAQIGLLDTLKAFLTWLTKYLNTLISNPDMKIKAGDLHVRMSFRDISKVLFKTDNEIDFEGVNIQNATFYQKAEDTFSTLKGLQSNLILDEATHKYFFNGKEVAGSVTDLVKTYYEGLFPEREKSEIEQLNDEIIRERGTSIHKDIESIINRHVDNVTGLRRTSAQPIGKIETDIDVYNALEAYIIKRLDTFDNTTRFLSEVRVYDEAKDRAGTIDFLAIKENGELEIFDWKSIQTIKGNSKIEELPWYKEEAYRIQLKEYKRILEEKIGAKVTNAMAIPIEANVTFIRTIGNKVTPTFLPIDIGDINPSAIPEDKDFLLPVVLKEQSTGNKQLDELIKRLYGTYDQIADERVRAEGTKKEEKAQKLKTTQKAIRDLQVRKSMNNFLDNGEVVIKNIQQRIKDNRIDSGYVEEAINQLSIYQEAQKYLGAIIFSNETPKELITQLAEMQANATHIINLLTDLRVELAEKMANEVGVTDITKAEKKLDWLKSTFRSISTLPTRTIRVFYQKLVRKQNERDYKTNQMISTLATLEEELNNWAKSKGIKNTKMFDHIYQLDANGNKTGKFITKYKNQFYQDKKKAIQAKDLEWLNNNTYFDKEGYEAGRKRMEEYIKNQVFSSDPEKNEVRAAKAMNSWIISHNAATSSAAAFNPNNQYLKPQDKHLSDEWNFLQKKENAPLKNVYDLFQKILQYSHKIGMLDEETGTFIPNIEASKVDRIVFGSAKDMFNIGGIFDKLVVDTSTGFGEINPVSGKQIYRVPVPFLRDLGKEIKDKDGNITMDYSGKSSDLFKVFAIWSAQMYNYEIMKDMEDDANLLYQVELNKNSLVTNMFGTVKTVDGEVVEKRGNEENAKIFADFMNYYIYNKTSDSDNDFTFKIGDKQYSGIKALRALVQFMSVKTLGFNVLSASANFFGGEANAFLQASKRQHFNEKDWASAVFDFSRRDPKAIALLDYFDVLLEDQKMRRANNLSVSKAVEHLTTEKFFELQRATDKLVQYPVLIAMAKAHMVDENGKIISIKKYAQSKNNYEGAYSRMSLSEKKELDKKINKEIEELKKTKSLFNTAKIENDKLIIPGIEPNSETSFAFRSKVRKVNKNILGNSTSDDINRARMSIVGQIMMQFRSWMPQMIIERFGDFTYDSDLETYQFGKTRQFFAEFFSPNILGLIKDITLGFGENTIERAKQNYQKLREAKLRNGEDFDISETEYIDLYLSNLRSQIRELAMICATIALMMVAKPGDDDDKKNKGMKKMLYRAFSKYQNELAFYYLPSSFTELLKSPVPIVGMLGDLESFMKHSVTEIFGGITGNEELVKKSHPVKYLGKMIPIVKEVMQWWGALDDDFAKQNGIKQ